MPNNFKDIIADLEKQKAAIEQALTALRAIDDNTTEFFVPAKTSAKRTGAKRVMSVDARKRIADAQKKRWAATKKVSVPEVAPKKHVISEEGRKRIAAASRKRWAAVRKTKARL